MVLKRARRGIVPPFVVMDIMNAAIAREQAGDDILHLEIGQPATPAPSGVRAVAARALEADALGYTAATGIPHLRERIAAHYADRYGVAVDPRQVVVTTGSSGGFVLAFLAAFDAGDRVALAEPGYPAYRNMMMALGIEPVPLPLDHEDGYRLTSAHLDAVSGPLDGLIVASPANPTGTMLDRRALGELVTYCRDRGLRLISDEIYHGIAYSGPADTVLDLTDEAVIVNGFSKYFSMTGWRIGWLVAPEDLLRPIECLAQNLFISAPTLSQHAASAVFDSAAELDDNVARYARNRAVLLSGLHEAGFDRLAPADGAFYIYADIGGLGLDSDRLCDRLLTEAGIALAPGRDFDPRRGRDFVRLSFAGSTEDMREAIARLARWLGRDR